MNKKWFITTLIAVTVILGGIVLGLFLSRDLIPLAVNPEEEQQDSPDPDRPEYTDITITAVGDILIHNTVYYAAYNPQTDSYDFRSQFQYVKPYLEKADITLANLETTVSGKELGFSGYPQFNTPDSIIDALKDSGVDILTGANNHRLDKGIKGFYRTIETVRGKGLDIIGVKAREEEKSYVIKDIKGIPTAFLNFGYGYPLADGGVDINGLILPSDMTGLMDTFNPEDPESAVLSISKAIREARNEGAVIVIVCLHWGNEYHRQPNALQQEMASRLVSEGADLILGGHPHVLQPAVIMTSPEGKQVPVFYSLGNFISDQRKETVNDIYTEQGVIASVTFRVEKGGLPKVVQTEIIPTWVNKKTVKNRLVYEVIPTEEAMTDKERFPLINNHDLERIEYCHNTVLRTFADLSP